MSKKALISSLLMASMLGGYEYKNQKQLEGSAIYIPKRHKFKRRNKR